MGPLCQIHCACNKAPDGHQRQANRIYNIRRRLAQAIRIIPRVQLICKCAFTHPFVYKYVSWKWNDCDECVTYYAIVIFLEGQSFQSNLPIEMTIITIITKPFHFVTNILVTVTLYRSILKHSGSLNFTLDIQVCACRLHALCI